MHSILLRHCSVIDGTIAPTRITHISKSSSVGWQEGFTIYWFCFDIQRVSFFHHTTTIVTHYYYYSLMHTRRTRTLRGIDRFDIFAFGHGTFVTAQTSFRKLVHTLVGRSASRFDHVENATFVRGQSDHFPRNFTTQFRAGTEFLYYLLLFVVCWSSSSCLVGEE